MLTAANKQLQRQEWDAHLQDLQSYLTNEISKPIVLALDVRGNRKLIFNRTSGCFILQRENKPDKPFDKLKDAFIAFYGQRP